MQELEKVREIVMNGFGRKGTEQHECFLLMNSLYQVPFSPLFYIFMCNLLLFQMIDTFEQLYHTKDLAFMCEVVDHVLFQYEACQIVSPLEDVCSTFCSSSNMVVNDCMKTYVCPILSDILTQPDVWRTSASMRGRHWILLGLFMLNVLTPPVAFDPATKDVTDVRLLKDREQNMTERLACYKEIENLLTGNTSNQLIVDLQSQLEQVQQGYSQAARHCVRRPAESQFTDIHAELVHIRSHLLQDEMILGLYSALTSSGHTLEDSLLSRERMVQDNVGAFVDRLTRKYPLYRDYVEPVSLAAYYIKYGLRLGTLDRVMDTSTGVNNLIERLTIIPTAVNNVTAVDELVPVSALSPRQRIRLNLALLRKLLSTRIVTGCLTRPTLLAMENLMHELTQLWKRSEQLQREKRRAETDMYKYKGAVQESLSDEQMEEEEMRTLFPDYYQEFGDELILDHDGNDETDTDVAAQNHPEASKPNLERGQDEFQLSPEDIWEIKTVHYALFHANNGSMYCDEPSSSQLRSCQRDVFQSSYAVSADLLSESQELFPHTLDKCAMNLHAYTLSNLLTALKQTEHVETVLHGTLPSEKDRGRDFNTQSNVAQAQHAFGVVRQLLTKIEEILELYPEHSVLLTLKHVCNKVTCLPVTVPLAKLLVGLELILAKAQDWALLASKEVSIDVQLEGVIKLIVQWRQLELHSWSSLLDAQLVACEDEAMKWWFHLYESLIESWPLGNECAQQVQVDQSYVDNLVQTMEAFLQAAKVGEFEPRVRLVATFLKHVTQRFRIFGLMSDASRTILSVLSNLVAYYSQFVPLAHRHILSQRKPLEKEIRDFTRIASWRDVNYESLKQSTQKSHRQLARWVRKFREVLQQPFYVYLTQEIEKTVEMGELDMKRGQSIEGLLQQVNDQAHLSVVTRNTSVGENLPEGSRLLQLPIITERVISYCRRDLLSFNLTYQGLTLNDVSHSILERISDLRQLTLPPSETDEEKVKHIMHQKTVKKRALVEVFRLVSKLGVSYRRGLNTVRATSLVWCTPYPPMLQLTEHADASLLHPLPGITELFSQADVYFTKLCAGITALRTAATKPCKDLAPGDVDKARGYVEDVFNMVLGERSQVDQVVRALGVLRGMLEQVLLRDSDLSAENGMDEEPRKMYVSDILPTFKRALDVVLLSITDVDLVLCETGHENLSSVTLVLEQSSNAIRTAKRNLDALFNKVCVNAEMQNVPLQPLDVQSLAVVMVAKDTLNQVQSSLSLLASQGPQVADLVEPIILYIDGQREHWQLASFESDGVVDVQEYNSLIENVMVAIQNLVKMKRAEEDLERMTRGELDEQDPDDEDDKVLQGYLTRTRQHFKELFQLAQPDKVARSLRTLQTTEDAGSLSFCAPLVHQYSLLLSRYLFDYLAHHKTLLKLAYVLCHSAHALFINGLCLPKIDLPDEEDEGQTQESGGMGIAEGTGSKDVSEDIEDEEQVLGTQDQENQPPQDRPQENERDSGIEMQNEFEGELEDVAPLSEDDEDQEQEKDQDEIDDQMGDVQGENAVDEKMWEGGDEDEDKGDQEGEEDGKSKEEETLDMTAKGEKETIAKEEKQEKGEKPQKVEHKPIDNDEEGEQEKDGEESGEESGEDGDGDKDDGEGDEEEGERGGDVPQTEANPEEDENMELPEDLNLDQQDSAEQEQEFGDVDGSDHEDDTEDMQLDQPEDTKFTPEEQPGEEDQMDTDAPQQVQPEDLEDPETEELAPEEGDDAAQTQSDQPPQVAPHSGDQGQAGDMNAQDNSAPKPMDDPNVSDQHQDPTSATDSGRTTQDTRNDSQAECKERDVNPHRSLGDALKEWQKRLTAQDADQNTQQLEAEDTNDREAQINTEQQFEYMRDDDLAKEDAQALGVASEDQVQQEVNDVENAGIVDEEKEESLEDKYIGEERMEVDDKEKEDKASGEVRVGEIEGEVNDRKEEPATAQQNDKTEEEKEQADVTEQKEDQPDGRQSHFELIPMEESDYRLTSEDIEQLRQRVESQLNASLEQDDTRLDSATSKHIWQECSRIVTDLSQDLCEQLRLILEPTLTTKYKGDYRTGKRLNLKRIIPYIASQFKKDKIWQRRTKPSKRDYHVLLSVDDSKSMAESGAVTRAYESLALIANALTRLEVGQVAVTSFGADMRLVHPFEQPFTDDAGAEALASFTFKQNVTNVKKLMSRSLDLLQEARLRSTGSNDLWQLHIILSDGLCQDHAEIQSLVRISAEHRILPLFIILDNTAPASTRTASTKSATAKAGSLLDMKSVSYGMKDGKMTMNMTRYMDTFPFEYFVVLRDVRELPHVLADALRQYFVYVNSGREV
jgi:midasin (ATPase involved in ribosome maturation)